VVTFNSPATCVLAYQRITLNFCENLPMVLGDTVSFRAEYEMMIVSVFS
jgi:hypothetical protein